MLEMGFSENDSAGASHSVKFGRSKRWSVCKHFLFMEPKINGFIWKITNAFYSRRLQNFDQISTWHFPTRGRIDLYLDKAKRNRQHDVYVHQVRFLTSFVLGWELVWRKTMVIIGLISEESMTPVNHKTPSLWPQSFLKKQIWTGD